VEQGGNPGGCWPFLGTVKAYVVLKQGATLTEQTLIDFCRRSLAAYKCPRMAQFVADLPKTSTGKTTRRELHTLDDV
jgi:long-chain acyl-CoA synthetase